MVAVVRVLHAPRCVLTAQLVQQWTSTYFAEPLPARLTTTPAAVQTFRRQLLCVSKQEATHSGAKWAREEKNSPKPGATGASPARIRKGSRMRK